jgi:hypothetical protein
MGHVAASELACARRRELKPRGHVAAPELPRGLVVGAGAQGHVRSFREAWCQETRAGATGHVAVSALPRGLVAEAGTMRHMAAPELPCARRREPRDTRVCVPVLSFILT